MAVMSFPVETFCASPPIFESTEQVWNGNSTPGSTVLYFCKQGFYNKGGHNVSVCDENGQWTPVGLSCQGNSNNGDSCKIVQVSKYPFMKRNSS